MGELVADYFLRRLREWDVHRIYGYPGDGINAFLGALDRADGDPDFIQARHEEMAAFMACGHAKFAGSDALGVCMATSAPAPIHLLNGLYDAKLDHVPVVAIVGQQKRSSLGVHYQQEIDLQVAVQGRLGIRPGLHGSGAGAPPRRPRLPDRPRPPRRLHDHRPERRRRAGRRRVAAARARLRLHERRLHAPAHPPAGVADPARRRDPERGGEGCDAGRPGRPRRRRGARARRRPARRRRRQGAARQGRPRRRPAVRDRLDRPLRDDPELRHDGGLRHAADGRHELPVRGVPAEGRAGALRRDRHQGRHDRHPLPGRRAADRRREGDAEARSSRISCARRTAAGARRSRRTSATGGTSSSAAR